MSSSSRRPAAAARYVLGIDFGTLSGRAMLVGVKDGREVASAVVEFDHGVIEERLPGRRERLEADTALQCPSDYLAVLELAVPRVLRRGRVRAEQVCGIGIDFTSSTILPVTASGMPLCLMRRWRRNPHAWVKLWKHHAAQAEADRINAVGARRGEAFVEAYGGKHSSEWFFAKVLETARKAPEVYRAAERFIEAGDWLVWQLCGRERRCLSAAGFKAMRVTPDGEGGFRFPAAGFFGALDARIKKVVESKVGGEFWPLGSCVGGLTEAMARRTGLAAGTPVAAANIDAHAAVPACGVTGPGKLAMILGTSTCHLLVSEARRTVEGMCGVVRDGVIPGYWGYEAGQCGVGDMFAWYVEHGCPPGAAQAARAANLTVYEWLEREAARLRPGESGLLALDWWNGNRSVLVDADLSGLLVGVSLATRPPEIYRALMEATAFGTRTIIEAFTGSGVRIDEVYACGGLAQKNALLMQIYADVIGRPIRVVRSEQTCALGAAMFGAVAAGAYRDIGAAARRMASPIGRVYRPHAKHRAAYDRLYREYRRLHDLFGRDPRGSMKVLKAMRRQARGGM